MTDINLEFIAEQQRRILDKMSQMQDELLVTGARIGPRSIDGAYRRVDKTAGIGDARQPQSDYSYG